MFNIERFIGKYYYEWSNMLPGNVILGIKQR